MFLRFAKSIRYVSVLSDLLREMECSRCIRHFRLLVYLLSDLLHIIVFSPHSLGEIGVTPLEKYPIAMGAIDCVFKKRL